MSYLSSVKEKLRPLACAMVITTFLLGAPALAGPGYLHVAQAGDTEDFSAPPVPEKTVQDALFLGPLHPGMTQDEVVTAVGEATAKDQAVVEEATGRWVQTWAYAETGLALLMTSSEEAGGWTLDSLSFTGPGSYEAYGGVTIGTSREKAIKALRVLEKQGGNFEADNEGAGILFEESYMVYTMTFVEDKVATIYIGPGPE